MSSPACCGIYREARPFAERALDWNLDDLPVPAEILVYTRDEWARLRAEGGRFARVVEDEAIWLSSRDTTQAPR